MMVEAAVADALGEALAKTPGPEPEVAQRLVYEYLVHNCFSETAKSFGNACQITAVGAAASAPASRKRNIMSAAGDSGDAKMEVDGGAVDGEGDMEMTPADSGKEEAARKCFSDLSFPRDPVQSLDARKHLYNLVAAGNIVDALAFCNTAFSHVLSSETPESLDIAFELQCQHFIESARKSASDALRFAQEELVKFGYLNPRYLTVLQDIVTIIAYEDPSSSPVASYLSQERREEVARRLNSYILSLESMPTETSIAKVARQLTVVADLLATDSAKDRKSTTKHARFHLQDFIGSNTGDDIRY
ncbi:CTLH/CRA C-terminal to lish motif domain-containing protein [Cladochytrium replicatum]|nr:CTLH/CRA C-terminal to lish motif domain-containing protein [Cladochytrium replicatum]